MGVSAEEAALPSTVVVFDEHAAGHTALRQVLPPATAVIAAANLTICSTILRASTRAVVIATVPPSSLGHALEARLSLHHQFPFVPIVPLYVGGESDPAALHAMVQAGMRLILTDDLVETREAVERILLRASRRELSDEVWHRADLDVPAPAATLLRAALQLAHAPVSLSMLASGAQLHERTLRKYCAKHALPSPQWIIGWARCLLAAYYLEEPGRSIESVAALLHFGSAVHLTNHLKRYTGKPASLVRSAGPLSTVVSCLGRQLASAA
jgi:AraC-like DNA-binding protein